MKKLNVMPLASRFATAVGGASPKHIGEYRFSDRNDSATVTTYSQNGVEVVCVVSVFADGSVTLGIFSDEYLSETNRFENISSFNYNRPNLREMKKDLKWVWETVDEYRSSWEEDYADE